MLGYVVGNENENGNENEREMGLMRQQQHLPQQNPM